MALVEEPTISTRSGELAWLVDCLAPIFDGLRQPVTVVDPSGRFVYYNRASGLLDGLDPQRALGMHLLQSAPWLAAEQSTLLRCLAEGRPSIDTLQAYVGAGGELLQYRHRAIPLRGRDGCLLGAMELGEVVAETEEAAGLADCPNILSVAPSLLRQLQRLDVFAVTDLPLLIHGETGTGKELFARRAHALSPRRSGPMISLNCAAIPETLLESTLFGTTRGAFTGAENRKGMFALAQGGSLFLDEINSMPMAMQSKLLRVLQDGSYLPLGSLSPQRADVRLIAASNQPPRQAIAEDACARTCTTVWTWAACASRRCAAPRRCGTAGTGVRPSRCAQPQPTCHRPWRTGAGAVAGLRLAGQRPATGKRDPTQPVAARGGRRTAG